MLLFEWTYVKFFIFLCDYFVYICNLVMKSKIYNPDIIETVTIQTNGYLSYLKDILIEEPTYCRLFLCTHVFKIRIQ